MIGSTLTAILLAGEPLLGAGNLGAASRRASRTDAGEALLLMLLVGGMIALVCVGIRFAAQLQRRRRYNSHGALFQGLCRTHDLDRAARSLLKQVARRHKLSQPARVFTEPKWLDPANLGGALGQRSSQLAMLRHRLFG